MRTDTRVLALVITVVVIAPAIRAQTGQSCTSAVTGWQGQYSLSLSGTATASDGFKWTVNETGSGQVNTNLTGTSCTMAGWGGQTAVLTVTVDDKGSRSCAPSPGTETTTITGSTSVVSESNITIDVAKGTYTYFPASFTNVTRTHTDCGGFTSTQSIPSWPIYPVNWLGETFPLPITPQSLTESTHTFPASWVGAGGVTIPWTLSFTLDPFYTTDDSCQDAGNSSIACQNQSLGEDMPIVGTGFKLHYESGRTSGASGNSVASADASMIGGWTLSMHHAYDPASNTLFLGDGSQRNAYQLGAPVVFNGNSLVTSEDGSEVYVFSGSTGQHLQTVRPPTGALKYQFGYDAAGNLVTVTDASGNVTTIKRNASEQPTAIVSPYGQTMALSVGTNGFLIRVTDPLGKSATFVNTSTGLLTSRTDENGNTYSYRYDAQGRLNKDADPAGGFTALTRTNAASGFGWTTRQTTAMARSSSYQDTLTLPWVQNGTSTFSQKSTNTWSNGLRATSSKTRTGAETSKSITLPDGTSDSNTLRPDPVWGIQVPITTSEALTRGGLTMNITGSRSTTLGTPGNPFSVATQADTESINGRTYKLTFTGSTRTSVYTTPMGRTLTVGLDSLERITSIQEGGLTATDFAYDSRGRLASATQSVRHVTFGYDSDGRLANLTDPLDLKTSFSYDADGRLLSTTLADGRVIDYKRDANGNLTAVVPPGKPAHNFDYTPVNLVSEYLPPAVSGTAATTYTYDADRDLTRITRPDGKTVSFDYDTAGRISSVITPTETINYAYSSTTGNLTSATITGGESLAYGYNGSLPASTEWTGTISGTLGRVYSDNFWVTSRSLNGANTITFTYDNDGLMTGAGALTLKRSVQNGLITGTTLGLATDTRTYNSFGELTSYAASYNGAALYNVSYTRDADGRVIGKTEAIGGHTNTYAYSFDAARRLIGVTENGKTASTYSYDTNSNRVKATTSSGTTTGTYDAQDRLLTYGAAAYTYTANGELEGQTVGTQKTTYLYDVLGNLTGVTLPNGTAISYVVDANNRRLGKKVKGVLEAGFLYDGDRIVAQLNGNNQIVSEFVYASGSTAPDYMVSGGVTYRIFSDQLGSPRVVANTSTGAIAEEIVYDEFGDVISDTKPGFQPFGFAGGLYDQDTKLVRFGARDYNPSTGRWTAKDPILFAGGDVNLYGYVLNDPVNIVDPSGYDGENCTCGSVLKDFAKKTAIIAGTLVAGTAGVVFGGPNPTKLGGSVAIVKALNDWVELADRAKALKKEHPDLCTP